MFSNSMTLWPLSNSIRPIELKSSSQIFFLSFKDYQAPIHLETFKKADLKIGRLKVTQIQKFDIFRKIDRFYLLIGNALPIKM